MNAKQNLPFEPTPSQTVGPFFHHALHWAKSEDRAPDVGELRVRGMIFDGDGVGIGDAMIEAMSASDGKLSRAYSHATGEFAFTVKRGAINAPLAYVTVFARGMLNHHFTFVVDRADHEALANIPHERRNTLVAKPIALNEFEWSIRMQGEAETAFIDYR